ncbi:hypothetical protein [Calidithermus chliarophilus]|uniref:hypothetical protein n=1 Tax=Calidithermus chliarophilus TaxID=52023 RepID=UPI000406F96E|nr:hypothetical protein [Calidithermus chliarophilus]
MEKVFLCRDMDVAFKAILEFPYTLFGMRMDTDEVQPDDPKRVYSAVADDGWTWNAYRVKGDPIFVRGLAEYCKAYFGDEWFVALD